MNPPNVVDVTTPRSHRTHKITRIVQSIAVPISQDTNICSACVASGKLLRFSSMLHPTHLVTLCLFTCAHTTALSFTVSQVFAGY